MKTTPIRSTSTKTTKLYHTKTMENNPNECRHYGKRNFFEWLMNDFPHCKSPKKESGICICPRSDREDCPFYEPKERTHDT